MTYSEDDRQRVRASLDNAQHHYVIALEQIAVAAYHVWKNTPLPRNSSDITILCMNDLYDALSKVDFMEGDRTRDD